MRLLIKLSGFTPRLGSLSCGLGLVVLQSTPPHFVNSQLVSIAPVWNFTEVLSDINNILRSYLEAHTFFAIFGKGLTLNNLTK